jgi:site-specific DNA recombinase
MSRRDPKTDTTQAIVRCAIYTRKSTEEGLQQEFNTLDAQRESAQAFIAAQKHEGWICLPEKYDDGGFTGGNLERPAMQRLLKDIEAGKVDCVVVYKVDRLSRSLMDFARAMQTFEKHGVTFVSVTQQFNTTHSMGRLTLNILLSFAQFEREIISERTRDKIAAARRKGKFAGGKPLLGYDLASTPAGAKLAVNEAEAEQVRSIYGLYLEYQALIPTVRKLTELGWVNKQCLTRGGKVYGGRPFDKTSLYRLLTSKTYVGLITHHDQVYPGEHPAIVDQTLFDRVQAILGRNGKTAGATVRNRYGALLKGLLHCSCCRCSMLHTYSVKPGKAAKRYRYYVCLQAQKRGWHTCPSKSVPAGEIERFVIDQIKWIGKDPAVLEGTLRQMRQHQARAIADLTAQSKVLERERTGHHRALRKHLDHAGQESHPSATATLSEQIAITEQALARNHEAILALRSQTIHPGEVAAALSIFEQLWEQLAPREQARVIELLVERVDYDGRAQSISITFYPTGIKALAREQGHEVAA